MRYHPTHDFQSCALDHSANSPTHGHRVLTWSSIPFFYNLSRIIFRSFFFSFHRQLSSFSLSANTRDSDVVKPITGKCFRRKKEKEAKYLLIMCGRRDLNPYPLLDTPLKRARMPIPPRPQTKHVDYIALYSLCQDKMICGIPLYLSMDVALDFRFISVSINLSNTYNDLSFIISCSVRFLHRPRGRSFSSTGPNPTLFKLTT